MSESGTFKCPTCGATLTTTGADAEIKCSYCGNTVIVPPELRTAAPSTIEIVAPQVDIPNMEPIVKPIVMATGGIIGISVLAPIILTLVILCAVGAFVFFIVNSVNGAVREASQPIRGLPTIVNVALTASALAKSTASSAQGVPATRTPTTAPTAAPTATATPAGTPTPLPTPFPKVLLQDNFTDPKSGWDTGTFDLNTMDYVPGGGFHILIGKENTGESVWIKDGYGDVTIEVDAKSIGATNDGWMGVLCRVKKDVGSYAFEVTSTGRYEIVKYRYSPQGSRGSTLMRGDLSTGPLKADTPTHLRADCVGSNLVMWVDGRAIGSIKDSEYASGGVGLIVEAGASGKAGVDVLFNKYIVRGP